MTKIEPVDGGSNRGGQRGTETDPSHRHERCSDDKPGRIDIAAPRVHPDTRAVVLYLSLTMFFLFLTLRVVESRRWK